MADLKARLSKIFGLHTAWHEAPAGDEKFAAWDALSDALDAQTMDSLLWMARREFRRLHSEPSPTPQDRMEEK